MTAASLADCAAVFAAVVARATGCRTLCDATSDPLGNSMNVSAKRFALRAFLPIVAVNMLLAPFCFVPNFAFRHARVGMRNASSVASRFLCT